MIFRTPIDITNPSHFLRHCEKVVLLGSCFADNIGKRLADNKFQILCNPFGTLYNPMSIAWLMDRSMREQTFNETSSNLLHDGKQWHSWMHHTSFSSPTRSELLLKMNKAGMEVKNWLLNARTLIVTFGTATVYELADGGGLVANCHKQPDKLFRRRMLTVEEIKQHWLNLLNRIYQMNHHLNILFTVSPIRHRRDGFHQNQLSKATLLLAVDEIIKNAPLAVDYFPAYEIMMDELRDYRFYAEDMVHPSEIAIDYIWERFAEVSFTQEDRSLMRQISHITATLSHRPTLPQSTEYQTLISKTIHEINDLVKQYPYMDFENEIAICNTKLEK